MAVTAMIATTNAATTKAEIKTYGTHAPVEIINVAAGESAALESDDVTEKTAQYLTIAKDGEGAVTVTGDIVKYHALMVREGKLEIGEGSSLTINIGYDANKNYRTAFSVAGKDSEVVLNNATLNLASSEPHLNVGGGSGNGTLTLDNGSYANLSQSHLITLGVESWVDGTYESASSSTPYRGNYVTSSHDGESLHGKGVINVLNGSVLSVGSVHSKDYGSFWMSEGELNVIGEGSKFILFEQDGYRTITNLDVGSTSVINVKDGGYAWLNTSVVQMNYSNESLVVINVDGENSELVIGNSNAGEKSDVTKIAAYNEENTSAIISVTNGGHLAFESTNTIMSGADIPGKVSYTVDSASSGSFNGLTVYNGVTIDNAGSCTIANLTINGCEITNSGTLTVTDSLIFAQDSTVIINLTDANSDTAVITLGDNATVTAEDGATVKLCSSKNLKAGTSFILLSEDSALEGLTIEGLDVKVLTKDGQIIITVAGDVIVTRDPLADVAGAASWGSFKSSHAFTGTLWGGRTNAVVLNTKSATSSDNKGNVVNFEIPTGQTIAWGTAYGDFSRLSSEGAYSGADFNIYGAAVGVEHQFVSGGSLGVAIGYDWGKVSPGNFASFNQESAHVAVYGRAGQWKVGQSAYVAADLSAALGSTESELSVGNVDQDSLQLDARVSYIYQLSDKTSVSAFVGAEYYAQEDASVSNVKLSSMQNLRTLIGAGINHAVTAKATVFGEVSLYNDAMRHNPAAKVDGFDYNVSNPGRLGGSITAGAAYQLNDTWTLRGSYSFEAAENSAEHSVNAGAVYTF